MSERREFDVVIVGGGPAGASAAINLATRGARVLLAEQEKFPRHKLCGEFISPECFEHFERLGVGEGMSGAGGAQLYETLFYAQSGRSVGVPSAWFAGKGARALGLSRAEMDARLLKRARDAGVEVWEEAAAVGTLVEDARVRGVRLKLAGGETRECRAPVTLDATGRGRVLAKRAEKQTVRGSKRVRPWLVAFKAHLEEAAGAAGVCEIYFYPGGYGGLSRVEGGASNLCFIARASDVRARGSDAERVVREILMKNARAAATLRDARTRTGWLCVALERFGRGELVPAEGLLAVGDAASFIDPFTGSGMLMALESGELAATCVSEWLANDGRTGLDGLGRDYHARYSACFDARLRACDWLRRAAFAPRTLVEAAVFVASNLNERTRRRLATVTRRNGVVSRTSV